MVTGTEGPDNLTNDPSLTTETINALGGDDVITVTRPNRFGDADSVTVNGGSGFDTLILNTGFFISASASGFDGQVRVREGNGEGYHVFWTSIERLELSGRFFNSDVTLGDEIDIVRMTPGFGGLVSTNGGNDEIYFSGSGDSTAVVRVDAGAGNDLVDFTQLTAGAGFGNINVASGGDGNDTINGSSFSERLDGGAGNDILNGNGGYDNFVVRGDEFVGGAGNDTIAGGSNASIDWLRYDLESGGGAVRVNLSAGPATLGGIDLIAGTARDTFGHIDTLSGIDRVTGGAAGDFFAGGSGADRIEGGGGADNFYMYLGGDDRVAGGDGNDNFFFGAALTAADVVTGGANLDTLVIQGHYPGGLTLSANVTEIEALSLLAGSNSNFGEPGTNSYHYSITTHDANFAAGVQAKINGSALLATENFTFNGSAETDASFVVYGGRGVDTLLGGNGSDIFFFPENRFAPGDTVNGGPGYDGLFLRGNYTIDFNAPGYHGLLTSIDNMTLTSATDERYARGGGTEFDYNIKLADAHVAAGVTLTVSGVLLMASETMILDGSLESDGILNLYGGASADTLKGGGQGDLIFGNKGADQLTGGGGADVFRYDSTADSRGASIDQIFDFTPGTDKIDLTRIDADINSAGDQAFHWIGSNPFSGVAGELRAEQVSGSGWLLEGDVDGNGSADFSVQLVLLGPTPLSSGDFFL